MRTPAPRQTALKPVARTAEAPEIMNDFEADVSVLPMTSLTFFTVTV